MQGSRLELVRNCCRLINFSAGNLVLSNSISYRAQVYHQTLGFLASKH